MQVKFVLVSRARSSLSAVLQAALQLGKQAKMLTHVEISMKKIALEEIAIVLRVPPPVGVVKILITFPCLAAEGEIPAARRIERHVFDRIPEQSVRQAGSRKYW